MKLKQTIKHYPLSSPQREICFDQMLHPEVPLYNVGGYVQINGAIDPVLFESAVNLLVQRHEALRTVLVPGKEEMPMQTFLEDLPVTVPVHDFSGENHPRPSALAWMRQQLVQPFDWYEKPLFNFALLKINDHCFFWYKKYHHLIVDGWSFSLIIRSLAEIYTQLIQGRKIKRAAPSYLAFVKNDHDYIESKRYEVHRQYWLEKYQSLPEPLFAPRYLSRFADQIPPGERRVLSLARPFYNRLITLAKSCKATTFHLILGALYVYLTRTGQTGEFVVGLPVLNRSGAAFKDTIGLLVGVSAARLAFGTGLSFKTLLQNIGRELKQNYRYQRFPIGELNREIGLNKAGRKQLFDISVSYLKHDYDVSFDSNPIHVTTLLPDYEQTPLAIYVREFHDDKDVDIDWVYNLAYFDAPEIERMQSRFVLILEYVLNHVDESIGTIPLLTEAEKQQLLDWNQTGIDYPNQQMSARTPGQTIVDLFQAQVEKTPDHIAVTFEGQALTYRELNSKANQLAHYLMTLGVRAETLVGIFARRSLEMVVGLLGILKAGGAYVPIDPDYPLSRLRFMLEDSGVKVFLSQSHLLERLPAATAKTVCLDSEQEQVAGCTGENPHRQSGPDNLAYVIYTSGSTGKPKGCQVTRSNVTRLFETTGAWYRFNHQDVWTLFHSYAFDFSVWEIWGALLYGAKLVVVPYFTSRTPAIFYQLLIGQGVTILNQTPSAFKQLINVDNQPDKLSLRFVIFGGEALDFATLQPWFARHGHRRPQLVNMYGITETTVHVTYYPLRSEQNQGNSLIGSPLPHLQVWTIDTHHQPVPIGVPGEMVVGGSGVARGYLNRPELTAARFVVSHSSIVISSSKKLSKFTNDQCPMTNDRSQKQKVPGKNHMQSCNRAAMQSCSHATMQSPPHRSPHYPITPLPQSPIYHTGDLGRWLPDGNLEFLGRLDHQIKLRGFRIELSEIEVTLSRHQAVKEAVVVLYNREDNPRLVAYVTLAMPIDQVAGVLRPWLKARLPEYMLPASFTVLDQLPLTPNGKIDRKALPAPGALPVQNDATFIKPQTPVEQQIAEVWQEVLKLEKVGIQENFFDLGGHSLLLLQVQSRLQALLEESLPAVRLFQYPTIQSLAAYLTRNESKERVKQTKPTHDDSRDIAIIGMAGRFPGAENIETFWNNLREGLDSIQFFSDEEILENGIDPTLLNNPDYVKAGGVLDDVELFDALFFGYTPKEAEILDPQQRLFLETAWTSIEHAGYDAARIYFPVGVFAGVGMNTYLIKNLLQNRTLLEALGDYQLMLGGDKDFIATRTAYKLNFKGPALTIQTACSTSLAAVHVAGQSLLNGECEMALAGGASISFPQTQGYLYREGMIASPDGHCRAFDASAQGTIGGSGVGVVVLKRLKRALTDGDTIHAAIKGSAINNDGMDKVGFTAPGVDGQASVITEAVRGIDYESISFIEAHGTGTILGDPIEISALTRAYRTQTQKKSYCALGSVKTNVGHLDTAAGVTGLIKTVLALKHREIPPSLHFNNPNPQIDFASSPFFVNTDLRSWQSPTPLRAGVSSFGIGGTNAHVVVEEAPVQMSSKSNHWQMVCLSAKTENALKQLSSNLADYLKSHPGLNLADIAYTLNLGRKAFAHRGFLISQNLSEVEEILRHQNPKSWRQNKTDDKEPPIVFMFPGQGAQYVNMAVGLYQNEPLFRTTVDECAQILKPHLGLDLRERLYPSNDAIPHLQPTQMAQPALFVTGYALAKLCMSWGIEPVAMIGHSIGEYVTACLAGVFSLADALQLAAVRGKLMQTLPQGEMLSLSLPKNNVEMLLAADLSIAAHNAPNHYVVSGSVSAIEPLIQKLESQQIEYRRLHTSHAFHSPMMKPILPAFRQQLQRLSLNPPRRPYISNLTGTWITAAQATSVDYWCDHPVNTVRFSEGIQTLLKKDACILLELGPGRALSSLARQHQPQQPVTAFNLLRPATSAQDDRAFLLNTLGQLWLKNVKLDWPVFYANEQRLRIPLPTYPFERQRYWIDPIPLTPEIPAQNVKRPLDEWFYLPHWKTTIPLALQPDTQPLNLSKWLIFNDKQDLGGQLAQALEKQGGRIVKVQTGKTFEQHHARHYTMNPRRRGDYQKLFDTLKETGQLPEAVLHLWSLDTANEPGQSQTQGFYSLLFLAQTWPKMRQDRYLFVISNQIHPVTGAEELQPMAAALLGPVQTMGSEYPDLHCRAIDIVRPAPGADTRQPVVDLLEECQTTGIDCLVAYRGGKRWIRAFESIRLPDANPGAKTLRHEGVYLITGGLAGIGFSLAAYLAKTAQARLVLIEGSVLPGHQARDDWLGTHARDDAAAIKIRRIRELQSSGAEAAVFHADIGNREQMQAAIEQAKARFGPIHGVIHAAGVPAEKAIELKTAGEAAGILSQKVQGSIILNELLGAQQLDFLVFCSSPDAVIGTRGHVDYCGANAFMDAYAHALYTRNVNAVSINWDDWQEVGAAGIEAFARILALPMPQVLISTTDWQQRSQLQKTGWVKKPDQLKKIAETPHHNRPDLTTGYVEPRSLTQQQIADIWQLLLGIEPIGIYDDFFELGGHSLLMTRLISRLHETFSVKLTMETLFEFPTIAGLAEQVDNLQTMRQQRQTAADQPGEMAPIPIAAKDKELPLSFAQQRLWFLAQLEGQSAAYNMPAALHLQGQLDETALKRALTALIQRHQGLRLCFPAVNGEATIQLNDVYNPLSVTDLSELPGPEQQRQVREWIAKHAQTPFNLDTGPLLSLRLLKLGKPGVRADIQEQVLLFNMHHIISDGWSIGVLFREWSQLYNAYSQNQEPQLPGLTIQYTDYAAWQKNWLQGEVLDRQLAYWIEKLAGAPELLEIPTDFPRPAVMSYRGKHLQSTLDHELTRGIKQLSRHRGVTAFMTLLATFKVLLYRYSGQTDLVVGTPVANRTHRQTEDLIGFFVNTLVLRTQIKGEQTLPGLLKQVRQTTIEAYGHQDIPFEYLVEQMNPSRSLSHSPLFQVMFGLQNAPEQALELSGLKISFLEPRHTTAQFDLALSVAEQGDIFVCDWEYCTDLFRPGTITRMTEHFRILLEGILKNPGQPLSQLPLLTEADRQQLLAWNQTETHVPKDETMMDLFQRQVEKTPGNIAVVFEDQAFGYRVLNTKANRLAHDLMTLGVGAETLVGICAARSIEMVIGLLGILKAGGAFVPLDPDYPFSRLQFILEDSSVPILLNQSHLQERLPVSTAKKVCLHSRGEPTAAGSGENPIRQSGPGNLAYMIYTSGSTGLPRGVTVEHSSLFNHIRWMLGNFTLSAQDKIFQVTPFSFDVSICEFYSPLLIGGTLLMAKPGGHQEPGYLLQTIQQHRVTVMQLVPSLLKVLLESPGFQTQIPLRYIICGGESLSSELKRNFYQHHRQTRLYNLYGPTEATIDTTYWPCDKENSSIAIGRPIANTRIYILDSNHNLTPPGIPGELCIAGAGLARGYLNRPELTTEKFDRDLIKKVPGKKNYRSHRSYRSYIIYHTGDLARWLPDGNLEFLGRLDHQVKLRGFRIELSEIEVFLSRHEAVKEAVVVLYEKEGNPRLVAYITLNMPIADAAGVLRSWLKARLPEYMLPDSFTVLEQLPLTLNGKIDRKALPAPGLAIQVEQRAPRTETQRLLCGLWSQVLGIEITSILSHFFAAGGHSLLATQLVSRIREGFGIEMPVRVVFEQALLQEQAEWLDKQQRGLELPPIRPLEKGAPLVLSFAQQRLWFLAQLEGQSAAYNIPVAMRLEGQLDETALQRALTALIQRHHCLRLGFPMKDGEAAVQLNDVYNPLSVTDLSELSKTEQQRRVTKWMDRHAQTPFELGNGPLLSLRLLKLGKPGARADIQEQVLLFNMHHIISDAWSMGVLIQEWSQLYNAYAQNRTPQLPELPIQYTDYAAWQRNWLQGEVLDRQLAYWLEKLTGAPGLLELPTDYPRPAVMHYRGKHRQSILDQELTPGIKQLSRHRGVTVFMTLLAAFKVLLFRYSGQSDLVVGSPIANRTHQQTEDLIGFFVNTLVLRTHINGEQTFPALLKQVRQTALEAYSHQDIPFEYLVEQVNPSRSLSHSPLFQVMLVLQNAPEQTLELSGLKMSFLEPEHTTAKFDLTLSIEEQGDIFVCDWEYCTDLFRPGTVTRMAEHFQVLLEGILSNPEQSLHRLPLLTEAEKQQLLTWNQTKSDYPKDQTIVDLFQAQVEKTPGNVAVIFEDQQLTYQELNRTANQLAHYLMTLGVGAETLTGICVERSLEMVIGLLGILKAGGAYLPIDPDYPLSRLQFMLEDPKVSVLLSQSHLLERLPVSTAKLVFLDSRWEPITGCPGENPVRQSGLENSAYVIYTSGSTGMPKGVIISHTNLSPLLHWGYDKLRLNKDDRFMQCSSYYFDWSVWEIFIALTSGVKLFVVSLDIIINPGESINFIKKNKITVVHATPTQFQLLVDQKQKFNTLKYACIGAEKFPCELLERSLTLLNPDCRIFNMYGPTEASIMATTLEINKSDIIKYRTFSCIPIGPSIANTQIYILDLNLSLVPIGVPGEIYIGGAGLARGYLNRPELTSERFINYRSNRSHMSYITYKSYYKTGDLARWLPDGNLEFLGRLDHQIKLRGFRIELSEIEVALSRHEAVKEAVVVLYNKEDNPRLVAYVTLAIPVEDAAGVLRYWLKDRLPEYMLPASFTVLAKLPLTPNGKIDRKALPAPDLAIQAEQQTPRTETQHLLRDLWSQVLGIEITGINSHFFAAGGHSLLATQLVSRIRESFGIEMPLQVVFEQAILQEQAEWLDKQQRGSELPPINPLPEGAPLVLSFAQQRLWFLAQLEGQSAAYNIPAALHLEGQLDETALKRALTDLIQRHHNLRLCFPIVDGEATVQLNDVYNPLSVTDLSELSGTEQQRQVTQWIGHHAQTPFEMSTGPLLSLRLLKLGKPGVRADIQEQVLLFNMHHIISDGWSMGVLIREWCQLYNAYAQNRAPQLPKLPIQYTDYAAWQRNWLEGEVIEQQSAYWIEKLAGAPGLLEIPTDYPRPAAMHYRGKHLQSTLAKELTQGIKQLSRQQGVTVFMTLLAAFKVLLSRYSGQTDLVVGSPIANRNHRQTEDLIGLFVNTLVLRTQINGEQTFSELLKQVKQTTLEAYSHQDLPFEYLVEQVNPSRSLSHSPLFQVMLVLQNAPEQALELSDLKMSFLEPQYTMAKFDLTLSIAEQGDIFVCDWEYNTDLFRPDTVTRMAEHFLVLLEGILNNPGQSLSQLPLLTKAELQQLLDRNQTGTDYPKEQTIVDLFQTQVEKTPDHIAVVFEEQAFSYRALNTKANQLAHDLMTLGVGAETLVGLCATRSLEMVIGLLAILKAGGAYVPLDPDYPLSRLRFILEDSSAPVLLSQNHLPERLPVSNAKVVCLDSQREQIAVGSGENPVRQSGPGNLAYVIYTSGSTGKPKGCQVTRSNVTRLFATTETWYHFNHQDVWTLFHSYAFDFSVWEIWGALLYGAKLVVVPYFTGRTPSIFYQLLIEQGVTVLNQTPSAFKQLINVDNRPAELSLRFVIFGGEALDFAALQPWFARHGDRRPQLVNMYGITETTVHVTYYPLISEQNQGKSLIGSPLPDLQVWVIDALHQPVPPGVPGEMVVGGAGVTRGYLNRPELTAEKFIEIEICGKLQRLYKTGDLARWLPDGNLEYLGRIDNQVKIRGFRVELGEIEACLLSNPMVKEAVVMAAGQDETKALTAYITVNTELKVEELREYIDTQLPGYMVPSYFVQLDALPLLPNGKINRKALAGLKPLESTKEYRPPQNDLEKELLLVWKKYLNTGRISTNDNFFEIGGNSLSLARVHWEIEKKYPGATLMDLFANPNIADLALFLSKKKNSTTLKIEFLPLDKRYFSNERESRVLEYTLNRELFTKLQEHGGRENLDIQDILRTSFGYLLFEISNQNMIQYYVTLNEKQIISIGHNYDDINSVKELLQSSRQQFLNPVEIHPVDDFMKTGANPGSYQVLPLYSHTINREFENTDLHLQADTKNSTVEMVFKFSPRMNREEMKPLPGLYIAILEEMIKGAGE